jgi:hypothetical protein
MEFWLLLGSLAVSVALAIGYAVPVLLTWNINAEAFMAQIMKLIMANNIDRAIKLCNAAPKAMLARVTKAGLTRANKGEVEIGNAADEQLLDALGRLHLHQPGGWVALVASISVCGAAVFFQQWIIAGFAAAVVLLVGLAMRTTLKIRFELDRQPIKLQNLLVSRIKAGRVNLPQPSPRRTRPRNGIFLCYRRADSPYASDQLYKSLVAEFGAEHVFKDVDSIPIGVSYRDHVRDHIAKSKWFLAVIGDRWLKVQSEDGKTRRIDDPDDPVRQEIGAALSENGIGIIPILVDGATIPSAKQLPVGLKSLPDYNGRALRPPPDFDNDLPALIEALKS